ncbi:MAG: sigma-70 family RNA polymerase sigma factor [Myxococcota bacterium]
MPHPPELDDLTLARARRGDAGASRALVERYQRPVFALLHRMLPTASAALVEDLAQETFLKVFRALPEFRPDGPARLSTWILTVASRLAIDELRRRPHPTVPLEEASHVVTERTADETTRRRLLARTVEGAVAALPAEYRVTFLLRTHHDLSYEEIAAALGVDVGTVKSRLSRAKAALRQALVEVHHEEA